MEKTAQKKAGPTPTCILDRCRMDHYGARVSTFVRHTFLSFELFQRVRLIQNIDSGLPIIQEAGFIK